MMQVIRHLQQDSLPVSTCIQHQTPLQKKMGAVKGSALTAPQVLIRYNPLLILWDTAV